MKPTTPRSLRSYYAKDQGELPAALRRLFSSLPDEVVQPSNAKEAVEAVRDAALRRRPIVARGAGSTAFGQVIPVRGGRVIDLCFLKGILEIDAKKGTARVESGVRWSDLSAVLEEKGLALGSYPSSWYTTVGGWIATGGLGLNSLKFGPLRRQVAALRVCLPNGEERSLEERDRLFESFFETEGQMGLVLEAELKVRPMPLGSFPHLAVCSSIEAAWNLLEAALKQKFDLTHASVYNSERMAHFNRALERKMRRQGSAVAPKAAFAEKPCVLFHVETEAERRRLAGWLKDSAPAYQAAFVWMERFYPLKGKKADEFFLGNEQVLPNASAGAYCRELEKLAASRGVPLAIESNAAGDDRSVVIASFHADRKDESEILERTSMVFEMDELGHRHGGRLYHVGIYNSPFIERRFDDKRLDGLRKIKAELDPRRLFNPGKFFDVSTPGTGMVPQPLLRIGARLFIRLLKTRWGRRLANAWAEPAATEPKDDPVWTAARECVNCGFCLPICPAYLATRDERTTARGKLFLATAWISGQALAPDDVERLHSCMHCAGCTRVCQSAIDLVPVWDELERRVAAVYGKPTPAIENFVREVESSADYRRLLRKGYITESRRGGAPLASAKAPSGATQEGPPPLPTAPKPKDKGILPGLSK